MAHHGDGLARGLGYPSGSAGGSRPDRTLRKELAVAVGNIAKSGVPLVVVEQDVEFLMALTDRLYMIEHGEVVREIDRDNAPDHDSVMKLYFGEAAH